MRNAIARGLVTLSALAGIALVATGACAPSSSADEVCVNNMGFCVQGGDGGGLAASVCATYLDYPCSTGYTCCQPKADAPYDAAAYLDVSHDTALPFPDVSGDRTVSDAPHDAGAHDGAVEAAGDHDAESDAAHDAARADSGKH